MISKSKEEKKLRQNTEFHFFLIIARKYMKFETVLSKIYLS